MAPAASGTLPTALTFLIAPGSPRVRAAGTAGLSSSPQAAAGSPVATSVALTVTAAKHDRNQVRTRNLPERFGRDLPNGTTEINRTQPSFVANLLVGLAHAPVRPARRRGPRRHGLFRPRSRPARCPDRRYPGTRDAAARRPRRPGGPAGHQRAVDPARRLRRGLRE